MVRASPRYSGYKLVWAMRFACVSIADFLVQAVVRAQRALAAGPLALLGGARRLLGVVAANSEVAIHAAGGLLGITIIPAGEERRRLGALPVGILTTETETLEIVERWGVETLQALAALPVLQLSERLGQEGVRLSELARGVRQHSLVLAQASSSFAEEMELDDAVEELEPLSFLLGRLLDQLCVRLEARAVGS